MTLLRDATEDDLPAILAIVNHEIAHGTAIWHLAEESLAQRRAWFHARRDAGFPVLVAERDGALLGFAGYGPYRPFAGYAATVEHSIYVAPTAQRGGIGRALLVALIARAEAAGLHVMVAGIEAGNAGSIALHRQLGFVESGCMREVGRKFDRWLDLVLMQRMLGR